MTSEVETQLWISVDMPSFLKHAFNNFVMIKEWPLKYH